MLFPGESDLIRRDSALKGLRIVLDPERLAETLRPHVHNNQLCGVKVKYVRYKPETSCLVSYHMELGDGTSQEVYAKAVKNDAVNKLRKTYRKFEGYGSGIPNVINFEDDAISIFTFPCDGKINALPEILNIPSRSHFLRKLLPSYPDLWDANLECIRYKPEQRFVGRLRGREDYEVKIKFYAPSWYPSSSLNAKVLSSRGVLRLPKRIGRSSRYQTVVFEWMRGCLLKDIIQGPTLDFNLMEIVGAALSEIHSQNVNGLHYITRYDESTSLLLAAADLGFIFPDLKKRIDEIAMRISIALESTPPLNRPVHGDFNSEQILIDNNQAIVLDLDNATFSDPAADLGLFFAHLEKDSLNGTISQSELDSAKESLLKGYESASGNLPNNIKLYTAIGLLRIATDFHKSINRFGEYHDNWIKITELVLERAWGIIRKNKTNFSPCLVTGSSRNVPVIDPFGLSKQPLLARTLNPADVEIHLRECPLTPRTGKKQLDLRAIRVARYKPKKRCIIEYDVELNSNGSPPELITLIGKVRMWGTDTSTYTSVQSLWRDGFNYAAPDGIMVPEPLGIIPEYRMWLQRKVPGRPAIELLAGPDGTTLAKRIVEAIYKIQQTKVAPHREQHTVNHELDILHRGLLEVSRMTPEWSKRIERIARQCDLLAEIIPKNKPVCSHRDFYFDHVIVDGHRLYLLDFDLYCKANPGLDTGNFIAHLTEYALRVLGDPEALAPVEKAMEKRFNELYDAKAYFSMRTYTLLTLARHIYLSTRVKGRSNFTEAILELCEERLCTDSRKVLPSSCGGKT